MKAIRIPSEEVPGRRIARRNLMDEIMAYLESIKPKSTLYREFYRKGRVQLESN